MNVMVTGGAGYIGSHAVNALVQAGHRVVAIDNLSRGHRPAVPADVLLEEVDLNDTDALAGVLKEQRTEAVMHFAALAYVGESVQEPLRYYANNLSGSVSLLRAMETAGVERLVFSSTCAVYGQPARMPIVESTALRPINPYGRGKLFVEQVLDDYAQVRKDFAFTALRYFNVAGTARDGGLGEDHNPETHLIPLLCQTAMGTLEKVTLFGDDYDTPDGTCIRDYIHVEDLIDAHVLAMMALVADDQPDGQRGRFYNLGIGQGRSVKQVVDAVGRVTGRHIPVEVGLRRPGDPPVLYANADKIKAELGWRPKITDLDEMIETAWQWFNHHPNGYGDA